jgi:hypothetical protein
MARGVPALDVRIDLGGIAKGFRPLALTRGVLRLPTSMQGIARPSKRSGLTAAHPGASPR